VTPDAPSNFGGGHIPTIVVTNHGPRGLSDDTPYNHYSLAADPGGRLRAPRALGHAADTDKGVRPMTKLFATAALTALRSGSWPPRPILGSHAKSAGAMNRGRPMGFPVRPPLRQRATYSEQMNSSLGPSARGIRRSKRPSAMRRATFRASAFENGSPSRSNANSAIRFIGLRRVFADMPLCRASRIWPDRARSRRWSWPRSSTAGRRAPRSSPRTPAPSPGRSRPCGRRSPHGSRALGGPADQTREAIIGRNRAGCRRSRTWARTVDIGLRRKRGQDIGRDRHRC